MLLAGQTLFFMCALALWSSYLIEDGVFFPFFVLFVVLKRKTADPQWGCCAEPHVTKPRPHLITAPALPGRSLNQSRRKPGIAAPVLGRAIGRLPVRPLHVTSPKGSDLPQPARCSVQENFPAPSLLAVKVSSEPLLRAPACLPATLDAARCESGFVHRNS